MDFKSVAAPSYEQVRTCLMSGAENHERPAPDRPQGSVGGAIAQFRDGDGAELGRILNDYFGLLLTKARVGLGRVPHTDPEGIVQSAMKSFLEGAKDGKFPAIRHKDELLRLLRTILRRKVAHEFRDLSTEIAGGGNVQNEPEHGLDGEAREHDPAEEASCREWLGFMETKRLRREAQLIWEGYRYHEIAAKLEITEAKARRAITLVHKLTEVFFGLEIQ
jgi:DNA-directed RNA polymerase specialized sigma24 family protein